MKKVQIPYLYSHNDPFNNKAFHMQHLNTAMTICRRLGFELTHIILGRHEWAEIQGWCWMGTLSSGEIGKFKHERKQKLNLPKNWAPLYVSLDKTKRSSFILECSKKYNPAPEPLPFIKKD